MTQGIADVLLRHVVSPQLCHFALSLPPMLLDKLLKAFPVRDFMLITRLEMGNRLIVPCLSFPFQPQV